MQRREFVKVVAAGAGASLLPGCGGSSGANGGEKGKRVIVVAFDGMDPRIVETLIAAGKLPNYQRLAAQGGFSKLATSTPPHTPVAFSSIISGADASVHQVYDFIHRDPRPQGDGEAIREYFSTADANIAEREPLNLGDWQIPLSSSTTEMLRRGPAFWDYLIQQGIDTDVYYAPSNYPTIEPSGPGRFRAIGGMGTPDLLGGYGEFTFYGPKRHGKVGGGRFIQLRMGNKHRIQTELEGPPNFLKNTKGVRKTPMMSTTIDIARDPSTAIAKIALSGSVVMLAQGEWSEWLPVEFLTGIPGSTALSATGTPTSVSGMVRLYLKQVHPDLELYVSPVNIDPSDPAMPISSPADFCDQIAARHGRFATVGIPEDTKALTHNALTEEEFIAQSDLVVKERGEQFLDALKEFKSGCLFFYFGATDLLQHMFWRDRDEQHPGRNEDEAERYAEVVADTYIETDEIIGTTLDEMGPDDTLIVFSDHGFTSFRRGFNLNRWLVESGYMKLLTDSPRRKVAKPGSINWAGTQAYGRGMNALYVNLLGREKYGIVDNKEARGLLEDIREKLMQVRDVDGTQVIDHVDLVEDLYPGADRDVAPDMIVGYNDGYRASWATVLGEMPRDLLEDNLDRWSGTHLISARHVPGMLFTSRSLRAADHSISDIGPSVLELFDIERPSQMTGTSFIASGSPEKHES